MVEEDHAKGTGFLSDVCQEWEAAAEPARRTGIRVVHTRFSRWARTGVWTHVFETLTAEADNAYALELLSNLVYAR